MARNCPQTLATWEAPYNLSSTFFEGQSTFSACTVLIRRSLRDLRIRKYVYGDTVQGLVGSGRGLLSKEAVKKELANATFNYHLAYAKNGQGALSRQPLDRVGKIKPGGG
jgi:hypothetical protein